MQVLFKPRDPQAQELPAAVHRHRHFAVRRVERLTRQATLQLTDVNGRRGEIDRRCQVEIKRDPAGTLVVASVARDWRTAMATALTRSVRFRVRPTRRGNDNRRLRQSVIGPATATSNPDE